MNKHVARWAVVAAAVTATSAVATGAAHAAGGAGRQEGPNPGMERMHELHMQGNPGMQRMHELHMSQS